MEALGGERHPCLQPIFDRLKKAPFKDALVVKLGEFLFAHGDAVQALVGQTSFEFPELALIPGDPFAPTVTAVPASVGLHKWNERLARKVACNENSIRLPDAETNGV